MHPNQKLKVNDWYIKTDPPIRITVDLECMIIPVESNNENFMDWLFVSRLNAKGYNIVNNPDYDNFNLEKDGFNKYVGEDFVEWFFIQMLLKDPYLKD